MSVSRYRLLTVGTVLATGLGIAVTCIIAHLLLTSKARGMIEEIELDALKLENLLARRQAGEGVDQAGA